MGGWWEDGGRIGEFVVQICQDVFGASPNLVPPMKSYLISGASEHLECLCLIVSCYSATPRTFPWSIAHRRK